jgi:MFS family permease
MFTGARLIYPISHDEAHEVEHLYTPINSKSKPQCPSIRAGKNLIINIYLQNKGLKRCLLYVTMIMTMSLSGFGMLMASNYKYYAFDRNQDALKSDSYLTMVGSIGSIFNSASRLFWGVLMDTFEFKELAIVNLIVQVTLAHTVQFTTRSRFLYSIFIWGTAGCYGGIFSMMPTLTTEIFGSEHGPNLYGVVFQGFILAAWIQFVLVKGLIQHFDYD